MRRPHLPRRVCWPVGTLHAAFAVFWLCAVPGGTAAAPLAAIPDTCAYLVPGRDSQVRFREAGRPGWFTPSQFEPLEPGDSVRVDVGFATIHYTTAASRERLAPGTRIHICPRLRRSLREQAGDAITDAFGAFMALARGDPAPPSPHRSGLRRRGFPPDADSLLLRLPQPPRAWDLLPDTPALRWVTSDSAPDGAVFRVAISPADAACFPAGPAVLDTVVQGTVLERPVEAARLRGGGTYRVVIHAASGAMDTGCVRVATPVEAEPVARQMEAVRHAYADIDAADAATPEVLLAAVLAQGGWYHDALALLDAVLIRGGPHAAAERLWDQAAVAGGLSGPSPQASQ